MENLLTEKDIQKRASQNQSKAQNTFKEKNTTKKPPRFDNN